MPGRPTRPQVIAFDVNETLFSLDRLGDALEAIGLPGSALDLWLARVLMDGFALAASGTDLRFQALAEQHLRRVLRSFALSDDEPVIEVMAAFDELEPYEDVAEALERLRSAHVRVVTLTNVSRVTTRRLLDAAALGDLVELDLDAEQAGGWKPLERAYRLVCDQTGLEPEAIAFVSSHSWDVHGASLTGMTTGWISRLEGQHVEGMAEPDIIDRTLVSLVDQLLALPPSR